MWKWPKVLTFSWVRGRDGLAGSRAEFQCVRLADQRKLVFWSNSTWFIPLFLSCEEVDFAVRAKLELGGPGGKELRTVQFVDSAGDRSRPEAESVVQVCF